MTMSVPSVTTTEFKRPGKSIHWRHQPIKGQWLQFGGRPRFVYLWWSTSVEYVQTDIRRVHHYYWNIPKNICVLWVQVDMYT